MYEPVHLPSLNTPEIQSRPILLSPFVRRGDLCLITGSKGSGKTTFLIDLLACLTLPSHRDDGHEIPGARTMLAGAFELTDVWSGTPPWKVLIIDAENDLTEWRDIFRDTIAARGLAENSTEAIAARERILYYDANDFPWNDLANFRRNFDTTFTDFIFRLSIRAVIIDSVHKLWTTDLNSPTWAVEGLGYMRYRFQQWGVTTFAIVHTSRDFEGKLKHNRFLPGYTSRQENEADTIFGLERAVKHNALNVHLVKRRAAKWNDEGTKIKVILSPTYGGYERIASTGNPWTHEREPKEARRLDTREVAMLSRLARYWEPFSYADFGKANRSRVRQVLDSLLASGFAHHVTGTGAPGNPKYFRLTELGKKRFKAQRRATAQRQEEDTQEVA